MKLFTRIISLLLMLSVVLSSVGLTVIAAEGDSDTDVNSTVDKYDKDKTSTELDENGFADVTLSIPGKVDTLASDIVFVIDKSSSDKLSADFANGLFEQLIEVQKVSGASVKVGVVIYNYDGHIALPLTELTAANYKTLLDSLTTYKSGTNADAGLVLAKKMLDADTEVEASRKHVILIGDGLNWAFDVNGNPHTILIKKDENATTTLYDAGTTSWLEGRDVSDNYEIPYGWPWDEYWAQITNWVEADGDKYVFDITNYKGEDTSVPMPDYNSVEALASAVLLGEVDAHALNMDRALYDTWESYTALQDAGYSCSAYYTGKSSTNIGYSFMKMLAGTSSMDFEDIKHDILYSVSIGSTVVDYMGYNADESYNFDFVDKAENLVLTVGDVVYSVAKVENTKSDVTSTYEFTAPGATEATFILEYYYGNGTTTEHFVWTINENISKFAPVSLKYKVELVERSNVPGEHTADTNIEAILYPKDSDGNEGDPEKFPVPTVDYIVDADPIDVTIEGQKFFDGVEAGGYEFVIKQDDNVLETVESGDDGKFEFSALTFEKAGEYVYTVSEVSDDNEKVVYDDTIYTVTIEVTEVEYKLESSVTVMKNDSSYEGSLDFNNKTTASATATIGGTKYLDDDVAEGYEFVLKQGDTVIETVKSGDDGKFAFETLTFDASGRYVYTVSEVIGDDENVLYDESVYTVIVTVDREGEAFVANVDIEKDGEAYEDAISFNNETLETIPDEDVPLTPELGDTSNFQWFALMALSALALVAVVKIKRKAASVD